ncbi:transposase [Streptomyces rochei]|nr:transposase [Streptomyces rochei]WMI61361.1 transposase [Streptomyces rochei]
MSQGHHPTQGGGPRRERGSSERRDLEKWRPALGLLDTLTDWQVKASVVVADAGYGVSTPFRLGLEQRGLSYVLALTGKEVAHPGNAEPHQPAYGGLARRRRPVTALRRERLGPRSRGRFRPVHRGDLAPGQQGTMASRFAVLTVRPAGEQPLAAAQEAGGGRNRWNGVLPTPTLLVERPEGQDAPTGYWISNLPPSTPVADLVRWAKMRWRIEHDYRELRHGLGLDHFEGRTWRGKHHHVTLVTAAQAFLTLRRLDPKAHTPTCPSARSSISSRTF